MVATGDWITPRLDGIKYFEKPPLQYWATAVAFEVFGANEPSARLYVWLAGFATLLIVGFAGTRMLGLETGLAAVLALVASPYFMALGGIVTLDMGLTLWTTATFAALLLAEHAVDRPKEQRRWMLAAWISMALAVLSKGLVGIVFAGAAVFFVMVLGRSLSVLKRMHWGWGIAIFLAIAAPWFVLVSRANPEFARFFFIHEHFERFLTHEHRRVQPAWFFIPIVLAGFLPWMIALVVAIRHAWRDRGGRWLPATSLVVAVECLHPALLQRLGLEAARLRAAAFSIGRHSCSDATSPRDPRAGSRSGWRSSPPSASPSSWRPWACPTAPATPGRASCT